MTNLTLKSDQYLLSIKEKLSSMASKKGVLRYRGMTTKAIEMKRYFDNSIICKLPREDKLSQIPFKWLWRHGLKENMILDTRKEACALALTLPAIWHHIGYSAFELHTNYNALSCCALPEGYNRSDFVTMVSDSKAIRIYKNRHQGHIDKIIQELQPEFIPVPFVQYNNNKNTEVLAALNIDMYGIDSEQDLYIIQVRRWSRGKRFNSSTKDYFLIGRNENGNAFCHSVEVLAFRNKKEYTLKEKVLAAQAWIFGVKFDKMAEVVRQGDMGFLCLNKALPKHPYTDKGKVIVVGSSHRIVAESILEDNKTGKIYALKPKMIHDKSQHETIRCAGWAEILIGRRKETRRAAKNSKD